MSLDCWSNSWESRVGNAKVVSELAHFVGEEDYTTNRVHVFSLNDGTYVFVHESGCSCYTSEDAELEVLPFSKAMEQYIAFKKEKGGVFSNLELLEMKSIEKEEKENEPRCKNCNT